MARYFHRFKRRVPTSINDIQKEITKVESFMGRVNAKPIRTVRFKIKKGDYNITKSNLDSTYKAEVSSYRRKLQRKLEIYMLRQAKKQPKPKDFESHHQFLE